VERGRNGARSEALSKQLAHLSGVWVSARTFTTRRKALSGHGPSHLHRWGEAEVLGSQVNLSVIARKGRVTRTAHRAKLSSHRACLWVTTRVSEVDAVR
jgi:hypothetical protein